MKLLLLLTAFLYSSEAALHRFARSHDKALARRQSAETEDYKPHYFQQKIDHHPTSPRYAPHTEDTFQQRYYFDASFYKPGGPVFLYIGGETAGPNRFANLQTGIIRLLMESAGGLGVILENRYYGHSYPFPNSTTDNLRFLTTEQTIADNAYFAQHAKFSGVGGKTSISAPHSPWILYGGSLAGAETAFSLHEYGGDGGILWAGIAASGTTKALLEYPQWYAPIQKYGPQDCVASITAIVDNIDQVFDSGDADMINKMKSVFGMESLSDGDFAQAIAWPIGGPFIYLANTWQELNWDPLSGSNDFWLFCTNVTNLDAPESITSVDYELSSVTNGEPWTNLGNYANYIKKYLIPAACPDIAVNSTACANTQDADYWADTSNSGDRSYLYTTCTEYGVYQVAPKHGPSLIANPLQVSYTQQWCDWAFAPGQYNAISSTPNLWRTNKYGGYNVSQKRLAHIDGDQDVWLDVCYHSNLAPLRYSTSLQEETDHPQLLISGGGHHWDSNALGSVKNITLEPQFIQNVHLWEIRTVERWMREWHASH
ncbi:hypothetical protein LTR09_001678 [Extremus antarcticus]|uniref:Extracelular serine carboxypeptidase n=1 Tax=Extremus antarcticus TaxID=702011 RepID=A0AAJ0LW32_9PEZI|nr:hypothetical protein LTR09_001678 [Extremus antarcticus]